MKAILYDTPGDVEALYMGEFPKPAPQRGELLIQVKATALNRADLLQRRGLYPPPVGASPIIGLEIAGEVVEAGIGVDLSILGKSIMALLPGGGYAEYVVIPQEMAIPIPSDWTFTEAAAIPEAFLTAYQALIWLGKLTKEDHLLIHAGASGVGTAAIQIAKVIGLNTIWVTASAGKHYICKSLGAHHAIDYKKENFANYIQQRSDGRGVDMVLDFIGGPYFDQNLSVLSLEGRLIMLGFLGGTRLKESNLAPIIMKRLQVIGSTLRSRSLDYKFELNKAFTNFIMPYLEQKTIKPVIDEVFNWHDVKAAHLRMEANQNKGKIILEVV